MDADLFLSLNHFEGHEATGFPLEQVCVDAVNRQPVLFNSLLAEGMNQGNDGDYQDYFTILTPETNWHLAIEHATKLGIGTDAYELMEI